MNKIIKLSTLALCLLLAIISCQQDEVITHNTPLKGKTFTLTASMPSIEATTRIALSQLSGDNPEIDLRWSENDELNLLMIQGAFKAVQTAKIKNISNDGKSATLEFIVPEKFKGETFDIYGIYGGTLNDRGVATVKSGFAVENGLQGLADNHIMALTFSQKGVDTHQPKINAPLQHVGSFVNIRIKNTASATFEASKYAFRLSSFSNDKWAMPNNYSFDITGNVIDASKATSEVMMSIPTDIGASKTKGIWTWIIPSKTNTGNLELLASTDSDAKALASGNLLKGKESGLEVGKCYYIDAEWDGEHLLFLGENAISDKDKPLTYDYSNPLGTLILNEGNMTTENGSVIYITPSNKVLTNIYKNVNEKDLGNVTQDIFIYNNKIWIISQNGKTSAVGNTYDNEGYLVIADLKSMKKINSYDNVFFDTEGKKLLNWPTHIAVDNNENIYLRDNNGIHRFNPTTKVLTFVEGTKGASKKNMAKVGNNIFAIQSKNLLKIEGSKSSIAKTLTFDSSINGLIRSYDDNLWVSTSGKPEKIHKVNPNTLEIIQTNEISTGKINSGGFSTSDITAKENYIYFCGGSTKIYRHDFGTKETKLMADVKDYVDNANIVYNNLGVHPITGNVYINTIKAFGWDYLINNISVFNFENNQESPLIINHTNYTRFPAGIFFSANYE